MRNRSEHGFTLIELLVGVALLSIVSSGFYLVLSAGVRGGNTTQNVTRGSEEARLGFNRLIRDTREADSLGACSGEGFPTCYHVKIDFDGDGIYQNPNSRGDFEDLTYTYHAGTKEIRLNGSTLMRGVEPVGTLPVFMYSSNRLEYDADANGVTTWQELDGSGIAGVGNGNGVLDSAELTYITSVDYDLYVDAGGKRERFYAQAQLRNKR